MTATSTEHTLLHRLNLVGRWLTRRLESWTRSERLAALAIKCFPGKRSRYETLAKTYLASGRPMLAIDLLLGAPSHVRRKLSIVYLLEMACRRANDHRRALTVLENAQADHPSVSGILIRLSSLYRDDSQFGHARALLLDAESLGQDQSIRRLFVETIAKNYAAGRESLRRVVTLRGSNLPLAGPLVNEVFVHYPDLAPEVVRFQAVVREAVQSDAGVLSPAERIELALGCRMIDEARLVHDDAVKRQLPLPDRVRTFYATVRNDAEPVSEFARLAWENEGGDGRHFAALVDRRSTTIDANACDPRRIVEIFIPRAFYNPADPAMVRSVFHAVTSRALQRRDLILVPRHQFNLRAYRPLLRGKTFSFHTSGEADRRHLRYKDGALSGYVTMDHCGYAGFASIASDFDDIRRSVANVPRDMLHENKAALYAELVETGRSKYPQPATVAGIGGRYVFLALQKVVDEVAELAWMSSIELLNQVARLYSGTNIAVVVKRHPRCQSFSVQAAMAELESKGLIVVSTASIHSLIAGAEVVFTANSGVGLEALVHGRPVVASGRCEYAYAATLVRNVEELEGAIADAGYEDAKGLEFLYYYTHHHAFKASETDRLERRADEWLDHPG